MMYKKGVAANFTSPNDLVRVSKQLHKFGIRSFDVFSPYPVHGLDEAMELKSSPIPWISLIFGLGGAGLGLLMQGWMSAIDYPLNIGGKPFFSWPAFIPITFELGVLSCALATFVALFFFCKLPKFESIFEMDPSSLKSTHDQFMVFVDSHDAHFQEHTVKDILSKHNAMDIRWIGHA